ncbi:MAG: hypothetical protein KAH68_07105 [Draconibacterium sp.]|nr:hypothetical protein [Draconibacterium sp.]
MKELISKNSSGKNVLIFAIATGIVYLIMPIVTMPKVMQFAGEMKILDLLPCGYNLEYVNALFKMLGEEGRHHYLYFQIPVDMIFPLLLTITNCLLIALLLKKQKLFRNPFIYLCFFPLISGIADYAENIGIIRMLIQYPDLIKFDVKINSLFSIVKYTSITISFMAIIVLGVLWGVKKKKV